VIIVGKSKIVDKSTTLKRVCKYSDVPTDEYKWVYNLTYRPIPYDLMYLKLEENNAVKSGWWTGITWKGLRLKKEDKIIAWKRNQEIYE